MARLTLEQRLSNLHAEAVAEFDNIQGAMRDERLQALQDRRFYSLAGAQWEGALGEQFANKPKFEVNKIHLAVLRIISEYRNNRITVDFLSKEGNEYDKLADTQKQNSRSLALSFALYRRRSSDIQGAATRCNTCTNAP